MRGKKIPDVVKMRTTRRILDCAEEHFAGKYTRIDVRYRGALCYIDAYEEPTLPPGFPYPGCTETAEEYLERLREEPIHLCRLRFLGNEEAWSMAMYTYSGERYEATVFEDGSMTGTPEDAFMLIANLYLS
jgi:hypothetical protein